MLIASHTHAASSSPADIQVPTASSAPDIQSPTASTSAADLQPHAACSSPAALQPHAASSSEADLLDPTASSSIQATQAQYQQGSLVGDFVLEGLLQEKPSRLKKSGNGTQVCIA